MGPFEQPHGAGAPHLGRKLTDWQRIVQLLPRAVVLLDADLRIVLANPAAALLFRTSAKELQGTPITLLVPRNLAQLLADGRGPTLLETSLSVRTTGGATTVQITSVAAGTHHLLVIEDVSGRVRVEQQLIQSEKQAMLGLLASGILREIANPIADLNSGLVFMRSIVDRIDPEELKQALDISLSMLDRMRQLLGAGPPLSICDSPRYELADVHDLLRDCISFMARDAERRSVSVNVSLGAPVAACEMDVRLIRQVLLNLLSNAMDAMPDGGRLEVRTWQRGGNAGQAPVLLIQVADTGHGIGDATLRKVFRPLFSTKPCRAGLGLSFCRQTVEEHGGQIRLASAGPDQGTIATVSLPLHPGVTAGDH